MISAFNGSKTYILAALAVMYGVAGFLTGNLDANAAMGVIWAALSTAAIRHGIANTPTV